MKRLARPAGRLVIPWLAALLGGCTHISGLNGGSSYACKAPEGVTCDSVSGTYANALQHKLPGQRMPAALATDTAAPAPAAMPARIEPSRLPAPALAPMPLRSSARILRLWFKPWEDADRDLYDQGYVYVQIDSGRWLVEHAQRQIRDAYAPLRPPPRKSPSSTDPRDGAVASVPPTSAARPATPDHPFPGLVPSTGRPDTSDTSD